MATDVLILNTGVTDLRRPDFTFADKLVGKGGLAKCKTRDMPSYTQYSRLDTDYSRDSNPCIAT